MIRIMFALTFITNLALGQNKDRLFIYWGYNRSAYTQSDIHLNGPGYDFTLKNTTASDRPTKFDPSVYFSVKLFTIPQYVYRAGYFITDNISVSLGIDHLKYVVDANQSLVLDGTIDSTASNTYAGTYSNQEHMLTNDFMRFEHSDGLNYVSAELDYHWHLANLGENFSISGIAGGGIGTYIPKTLVNLFGNRVDNSFHIAGYGASLHGKIRFYYRNTLFITTSVKSGWAFLPGVFVDGTDEAFCNHNFGWIEHYAAFGGQFYLRKKKAEEHRGVE